MRHRAASGFLSPRLIVLLLSIASALGAASAAPRQHALLEELRAAGLAHLYVIATPTH